MQKFMARGTIVERELSEMRLLVERHTGTLLDCPNSVFAKHVTGYLESQELDSAIPLLDLLRSSDQNPTIIPQFVQGLLDTTTGFFRHPGAMNALTRQVLPQLYSRKSAEGGQVRIWSAGCATGEEPYSIAMAVCNASSTAGAAGSNGTSASGSREKSLKEKDAKERPGLTRSGGTADAMPAPNAASARDWAVQIIGSDLLPSSIRTAERGIYPQSALDGLPPAIIRASFSKSGTASRVRESENPSPCNLAGNPTSGNSAEYSEELNSHLPAASDRGPVLSAPAANLQVKARLRSMVTFNVMNLVRPVYIGRFDCIFCMDVLPSLSRGQRTALIERLHLYLEPGGYLFLSQTEKLSAPNLNFRPETFDGYTFHRKPLAASAAYGR